MWICRDCGEVFPEPLEVDASFDHAFGREKATVMACPNCQEGDIITATDCKKRGCRGYCPPLQKLCRHCREDLKKRVCDFFDTMTAEEEYTFDEWMESGSVVDRHDWEI